MVNQLQDAFTILGHDPMSLPQIAVVGGQSAGKSRCVRPPCMPRLYLLATLSLRARTPQRSLGANASH